MVVRSTPGCITCGHWRFEYRDYQPRLRTFSRGVSYHNCHGFIPNVKFPIRISRYEHPFQCNMLTAPAPLLLHLTDRAISLNTPRECLRAPAVYLFTTLLGFVSVLGSGYAKNCGQLIAARVFNSLFPVKKALGAATAVDMFFFHQR